MLAHADRHAEWRVGQSGHVARSPIVGGDLSKIWMYIVGPIIGAVLGWVAWRFVDGGTETVPRPQPAGKKCLPERCADPAVAVARGACAPDACA
jgi:hypothetical protein